MSQTDIFTEHQLVNYYFHNYGQCDGPLCRVCGEIDENIEHIICDAIMNSRFLALGNWYLELMNINLLNMIRVPRFLEEEDSTIRCVCLGHFHNGFKYAQVLPEVLPLGIE